MDETDVLKWMFIILILVGVCLIYDEAYLIPIADATANSYCKANGFDQFISYSRVGLFSSEPLAIRCEYAERFTDLGVRTNE